MKKQKIDFETEKELTQEQQDRVKETLKEAKAENIEFSSKD